MFLSSRKSPACPNVIYDNMLDFALTFFQNCRIYFSYHSSSVEVIGSLSNDDGDV